MRICFTVGHASSKLVPLRGGKRANHAFIAIVLWQCFVVKGVCVCVCLCIYLYVCMCTYVWMYIYIYMRVFV